MEIVKERKKKVRCPTCKSILKIVKKDVTVRKSTDYLGDENTPEYFVDCPACGGKFDLGEVMPEEWKS